MIKNLDIKLRTILQVAASLLIIVLINILVSFQTVRYDITSDQRFTLKDVTVELLEDEEVFKEHLTVKVYFTGNLPPDWERFRQEIELKLDAYKAHAGSRMSYEFVNPFEDPETQDTVLAQLRRLGLDDIVIGDFSESSEARRLATVPGAVLSYPGSKDVGVSFIPDQTRGDDLLFTTLPREIVLEILQEAIVEFESKMTSAIKRVIVQDRPVIAFLEGHEELTSLQTRAASRELSKYYDVTRINLLEVTNDSSTSTESQVFSKLANVDLLIVAKPQKEFQEIEKFLIDQFVMKGGKVIWSLDMVDVDTDTLQAYGGVTAMPFENNLNLIEMLHRYGVRIEPALVLDHRIPGPMSVKMQAESGEEIRTTNRLVPWDFFPLTKDHPNQAVIYQDGRRGYNREKKEHIISKRIRPVKLEYANFITVLDNREDQIKKTVVLETSDSSSFRRPPIDVFYNLINQAKQGNQAFLPVAVLLEGKFESIYKNRLKPRGLENSPNIAVKEISEQTKMMVISDGDIFRNDLYPGADGQAEALDLSKSIYASRRHPSLIGDVYGNAEFLMNTVNYLLGDEDLITIRGQYNPRRLDPAKVEEYKSKWQFINIGMPLLILAILGALQVIFRRYRFSS